MVVSSVCLHPRCVAAGGVERLRLGDAAGGALDLGVTLFDTAEVYGPWTNEALVTDTLSKAST
jgi:aryl-alcohol dehydrogenase-like predicted oxidoreductase